MLRCAAHTPGLTPLLVVEGAGSKRSEGDNTAQARGSAAAPRRCGAAASSIEEKNFLLKVKNKVGGVGEKNFLLKVKNKVGGVGEKIFYESKK